MELHYQITQPEKTADILQCHYWFPLEMMSKEQMQKFYTDNAASLNHIWVVLIVGWSKFWNFSTCSSDIISRKNGGSIRNCWLLYSVINLKFPWFSFQFSIFPNLSSNLQFSLAQNKIPWLLTFHFPLNISWPMATILAVNQGQLFNW